MKPSKVSTILEQPESITFYKIEIFLCFPNFYAKLIISFSKIVKRPTDMPKDEIQTKFKGILFSFIPKVRKFFLIIYKACTIVSLL